MRPRSRDAVSCFVVQIGVRTAVPAKTNGLLPARRLLGAEDRERRVGQRHVMRFLHFHAVDKTAAKVVLSGAWDQRLSRHAVRSSGLQVPFPSAAWPCGSVVRCGSFQRSGSQAPR